jgi:hypothetical protein
VIALSEIEVRQEELTALYEEIFGEGYQQSFANASFEPAPMSSELKERLEKVLEADPALKAKYTAPAQVGERSDREFHICAELYAAGFNEAEIYTIMDDSPQEKWHSRGDDYRIRTIRRAIEAEESSHILSVDDAQKVLAGLKERVQADSSAINNQIVLQALAVLSLYDPISYGIMIDGLKLTQTVKVAVKRQVKMIADALHVDEEESQEEQADPEIVEEAMAIIESGNPIKYILDTLKQFHAGDQKSAELLLCSIAIGSCLNAYGTQPKLSGGSGKGKTHLCKAMRHLMPPEWILYTSLSPKALYRATDPSSPVKILPGMVIFSDDVRISEDMEDTLKRSMSNFQEKSSYMVVQDGELRPLHLPERLIWWMTSVQDDQEEQLINRFFSVGVDESAEQDKAALELTFEPLALGRREFPQDKRVLVCREILRIIKSNLYVVWAPFLYDGNELTVEWQNPEERRNPGRFSDLIAAFAILRIGQREVIEGEGYLTVIATIDDFHSAKALYESRAENLTTKLNDDDLHLVHWLISKANGRPYDFTVNGLAQEYTGRNSKQLSSKTLERRLLGRIEKNRTSHGLIHKIAGGALIVETKSESEEITGTKRQQRTFKQFTFDPTKYNQLETYSKVVTLKPRTIDAQTHKTHQDPSDGSSPTTPQHSGLEEERYNKTHKTQEMRGNDFDGCKKNTGCDIFKKKYPTPSQDGSSGSGGSTGKPDSDPIVVYGGSELGPDPGDPQSCGRCGNRSMELIDLPGGSFCMKCAKDLHAQDVAHKEMLGFKVDQSIEYDEPIGSHPCKKEIAALEPDIVYSMHCLACGNPIGDGHGTYSGSFCASCGPKLPMVKAAMKAHADRVSLSELWEDLASRGRPPRKEHLPDILQALGYVEFEGMWMRQP